MSVHWAAIATIGVPAVVSVAAALYAAREARRARQSELEAERLRRAEERAAEHKYQIYKPVIDSLGRMFDGVEPDVQVWKDFWTWISIYGSAHAVEAYGRLMQCGFTGPRTPVHVLFRLATDFVLAVRREIGDTGTELTPLAMMTPKIIDLYGQQSFYLCMTLPFDELCRRCNWLPPWERAPSDMADDADDLRAWEAAAEASATVMPEPDSETSATTDPPEHGVGVAEQLTRNSRRQRGQQQRRRR